MLNTFLSLQSPDDKTIDYYPNLKFHIVTLYLSFNASVINSHGTLKIVRKSVIMHSSYKT